MIIFKKTILALTGLFICLFLIAHLGANFLLLLPQEMARTYYNAYSATLRGNVFISVIAYINYACILFHVLYAILVTRRNSKSRNKRYEMNKKDENSSWTSQNMLLLGFLILGFLIIHLANFWYKVKILHQEEDLYQMVYDLFHEPLYLVIYIGAAIPIGLHLSHGVQSAFKTLGLYHHKYLKWIAKLSIFYAWVTGVGFAIIPLVVYFR